MFIEPGRGQAVILIRGSVGALHLSVDKGQDSVMMTFVTQGGEGQGDLIDGGLYFDTALRKARVGNAVYSRHQSTKASKPPNQKHLRLVEVPRTESIVVESVGAILPGVAVERVEVGGLEGVLPALRGPLVT